MRTGNNNSWTSKFECVATSGRQHSEHNLHKYCVVCNTTWRFPLCVAMVVQTTRRCAFTLNTNFEERRGSSQLWSGPRMRKCEVNWHWYSGEGLLNLNSCFYTKSIPLRCINHFLQMRSSSWQRQCSLQPLDFDTSITFFTNHYMNTYKHDRE